MNFNLDARRKTNPPAIRADAERLAILAVDLPVMYEDEGQEEMGETPIHVDTDEVLHNGIRDHLADRPRYRVFSNLNVYYHPIKRKAFFSADTIVVEPIRKLGKRLTSYRIGQHGPAPVLAAEVLSRRSFQQQDLAAKPILYADLGIAEYILVDVTARFLPERLLLKRLKSDGTWQDLRDADGGVTSRLGFRVVIEGDGRLRVLDAATSRPYVRPDEATEAVREAEDRAREAEERIRALEAELARLRHGGSASGIGKPRNKRRRKS